MYGWAAMRLVLLLLASSLASSLVGCMDGGGGGGGPPVDPIPATTTSSLCAGITGPTAVYWDMGNGIAVPLGFVPVPEAGWPFFVHPTYPALGFQHPPTWSATPSAGAQSVGVDLVRSDRRAAFRYLTTTGDPAIGARGHRDLGDRPR